MSDDMFVESILSRIDGFIESARPELVRIAEAYLMREAIANQQAALQEQADKPREPGDVMYRSEADGDESLCDCEIHSEETEPRLAVLSGKEDVTEAWALEPVKDDVPQPNRQFGRKLFPVIGLVAMLIGITAGGVGLVSGDQAQTTTTPPPVVVGNAPKPRAPAPVTIPPITVVATETPLAITKTVVQPPVTVTATMPVIVTIDPFGLPN
jgi:hypothetical protein